MAENEPKQLSPVEVVASLDDIIKDCRIEKRISSKTNKPYEQLVIVFDINGSEHQIRHFIDRADRKIIGFALSD